MAEGTKLVLGFQNASGTNMTLSYSHAKASATAAQVKSLMNGIIANGSIFANVPATAKSAKIVTTTEAEYDLSA